MSYNRFACPEYRSHETVQVVTTRSDRGMERLLFKQITIPCPDCGREMEVV